MVLQDSNGNGHVDAAEQTPVDNEEVRTESVNSDLVRFVNGFEGASAVQSVLNDVDDGLSEEKRAKVVVCGDGQAEWTERVTVPSYVTLEFADNFSVRVPDDHNLGTVTVGGGDWRTVVHNDDLENGNEYVKLVGVDVDYAGDPENGSSKTQEQNAAAVWLHNCHKSRLEECVARNVLPGSGGTAISERPFGVCMSLCSDSQMVDCEADNVGYESIAIRGNDSGCEVIRCEGRNGGAHSMQVASFSGEGVDLTTPPRDLEVRECRGNGQFTIHGPNGENPARNITVKRCSFGGEQDRIRIIEAVENVTLEDNFGCWVRIESIGGDDIMTEITVDGQEYSDGNTVEVVNQSGRAGEFDNITIQNVDKTDSGHILRIRDYSSNNDGTFGRFTLRDCTDTSGETLGFALIGANVAKRLTITGGYTNVKEAVRTQGGSFEQLIFRDVDLDVQDVWADHGGSVDALVIDGSGEAALGGSAPDATVWPQGTTVEDSDNPGTLYHVYDNTVSGGVSQVST